MEIKVAMSIVRTHSNVEEDYITVQVEDTNSHIRFLNVKVTLGDFSRIITGLHLSDIEAEVRGLEHVGKVRVREDRSIHCPLESYSRKELEEWLMINAQEEGWIVNCYLSSQSSISHQYDKTGCTLRYSVHKFVDPKEQ